MTPRRRWTNDELDFLKENYLLMDDRDMAAAMGRTKWAVSFKRLSLGLEVPKDVLDHRCKVANRKRLAVVKASRGGKNKNCGMSKAHGLVNMRKRRGKLKPPKLCEVCGKAKKLDAHHPDYSKPLEVVWTCRKCHAAIHLGG